MSAIFDRLYEEAFRREHALVFLVHQLTQSMESTCAVTLGRLGRSLLQQHTEFLEDLEAIAIAHRMPRPSKWAKCPSCDDPTCPGAQVVGQLQQYAPGTIIVQQFYKQ